MRPLRWFIAVVLLVQRIQAELRTNDDVEGINFNENQDQDSSAWSEEADTEDGFAEAYTEAEAETAETTEEPYERKLSPRERIMFEDEERWQRGLEKVAQREREEALQEEDPKEMPEEYPEDSADPQDDDEALAAYLERQRRLEEQSADQSGDGDEEEAEALPVIPGLTDVELIAFNAEYAEEEVLEKIIDWSYDQVAALSRYRDNYIHVEDLYQFLLKTLNPLDEEIDQQDEEILTDAVAELRKQQGLVDEEQIVYRGFIARGMPLRFLQSLAQDMHQTVQMRRLQANDEL